MCRGRPFSARRIRYCFSESSNLPSSLFIWELDENSSRQQTSLLKCSWCFGEEFRYDF